LTGNHAFEFLPSEKNPGGTKLIQSESFTGILTFYMGPSMPGGKKTVKGFQLVNEQLKAKAEELAAKGAGQ
jgi:hypothetical protein